MDTGNFRHWDADYFHYDLSERDRRRLYCRVPSQSDGSKRVFLSFVSVLPQNVLLIPAYLIMGTCAIAFSLKLIRQLFVKRSLHDAPIQWFGRYAFVLLVILFLALISSLFEAYLSPVLMEKLTSRLFKIIIKRKPFYLSVYNNYSWNSARILL